MNHSKTHTEKRMCVHCHLVFPVSHFPFFIVSILFISHFSFLILPAAEIHFKTPVQCDAAIVTLGDVAEITGQGAESLAKMPLFPAPIAGGQRTVSATQIRNLLADRQMTAFDHDFRGVEQIVIDGPKREPTKKPGHVNVNHERKVGEELTDMLLAYLNRCTTDGRPDSALPWKIKLQLTPEQIRAIADGEKITGMYGGKNPLVGTQEFQAELQTVNPASGRRTLVRFTAEIDLPPKVVVARRALQRGKLLNENDIRIEYQDKIRGTDYFSDPGELLGKAVSANVQEGAVLTSRSVHKPVFVKKGEVVTVVAKTAGITVTSTGKALEDGSEGDLVMVDQLLKPTPGKGRAAIRQSLDSTFVAKVTAIGTVEVFATGSKY